MPPLCLYKAAVRFIFAKFSLRYISYHNQMIIVQQPVVRLYYTIAPSLRLNPQPKWSKRLPICEWPMCVNV
jgi:hypothetical protein